MAKKKTAPVAPIESAKSEFAAAVERKDDLAILQTLGRISIALLAAKLPVDEARRDMDKAATTALGATEDSRTKAGITALQNQFVEFANFTIQMKSTPTAKTDTSAKPPMTGPKSA